MPIVVLHVATEPVGGGAELLVRELNRRLPDHGITSATVYLSNRRGDPLEHREYCLGCDSPRSPAAIWRLHRFLRNFSREHRAPVIVHAHLTWPFIYTPLAASLRNVSLVYTEHSTYNSRRRVTAFARLERLIYQRYKRIICISRGVRDALSEWLAHEGVESTMTVISNGARLLSSATKSDYSYSGKLRVVSVGSLNHRKGFDVAIRAVAARKDLVERYTIVGEGPERRELARLIEQLSLQSVIRLVGWSDEVGSYLAEADVAIVPSRWEGFGLAAVEAMSVGLPVIGSDVPGLREVLENEQVAYKVSPESPNAVAHALSAVHAALIAGQFFAIEARDHAERFGLERMVARYADEYRSIIS